MNLGIKRNIITVKDLYDYASQHNLLNSEVSIVLDIVKKAKFIGHRNFSINIDNISGTIDFGDKVEYSTEDVLNLLK